MPLEQSPVRSTEAKLLEEIEKAIAESKKPDFVVRLEDHVTANPGSLETHHTYFAGEIPDLKVGVDFARVSATLVKLDIAAYRTAEAFDQLVKDIDPDKELDDDSFAFLCCDFSFPHGISPLPSLAKQIVEFLQTGIVGDNFLG